MSKRSAGGHAARPPSRGTSKPKSKGPSVERELLIGDLAVGGAGVARDEGRVLLLAGVAPGDRVLARLEAGRAAVLRVLAPGPDRVPAPCPVVALCGGCDWMHLSVEAQRREHARIVLETVAHALGLDPQALPRPTLHEAPRSLGYRSRARLFARATGRVARVGYRAAGSRDLVPTADCMILDPTLATALPLLEAALAGSHGDGEAQIALGRGPARRAPVVDLSWRGELAPAAYGAFDEGVRAGRWAGARVQLEGAAIPATFGDPRPILEGFDGQDVAVDPGGFAQASDEGAALLARRVAALAAPAEQRVLELFAGSGTLSIALAEEASSFVGVEQSEPAVRAARANLEARGLSGKMVGADAARYPIARELDVVVLDPPRSGAREAVRAVARARPRRVVYVGCDPATLARDLAELCGGPAAGPDAAAPGAGPFAVVALELFELFPQTSHVETVVLLERVSRARGSS